MVERMSGVRSDEAQPVERGADADVGRHARRRAVAHGQQRADDRGEGRGVDDVDGEDAAPGDEQARQRRAGDGGDLPGHGVEAERVGQVRARHQQRDQRLARRRVERQRRAADGDDGIEHGGRAVAGVRGPRQRQRARRHQRLRDEHQAPAIERVGDDAAAEREQDDGDDPEQADQAQRQRRAGQLVDLIRHRHRLHLRAGERDELAEEEQTEVARAQRGEAASGHRYII